MLARASLSQIRTAAAGIQRRNLSLSGVLTNLVTPYKSDGSVDFDQLEKVTNNQIENGVTGVIPMGTTGECFAVFGVLDAIHLMLAFRCQMRSTETLYPVL